MKGLPDIFTKELEALIGSETSLTRLFDHVDGALVSVFHNARNEKAHRKAQEEAQAEKRQEAADKDKQQENQQSTDLHIFIHVLDQIEQRIAELEKDMAKRYKLLEDKYGEHVLDGMIATYLSEEQQVGLVTDEQKHRALTDQFLNGDGTIKPAYEDMTEALYIRDWNEHEELKLQLDQLNEKNSSVIEDAPSTEADSPEQQLDSAPTGFTFR